jgi:hypothetical protein
MCSIQYQSLLVLLDPSDGIFQSKVEKQWCSLHTEEKLRKHMKRILQGPQEEFL